MNSNKFFNLKRFFRFFCTDLRLNKKNYLFYFAGLTIGVYLFLLWNMSSHANFSGIRYFSLFVICIMGLGAFVGDAFNDLNSKTKTRNYLLLPASTFEKVLSQFVIRFVFGGCLFLLLFWVDAHLARETRMHTEAFQACAMILLSHLFYPAETVGWEFRLPEYKIFENINNIELFIYSIFYFAWLFLLPLSYFKLKEKQV